MSHIDCQLPSALHVSVKLTIIAFVNVSKLLHFA